MSHSALISARNDVFPVLFSPTNSVSGASRTVCLSPKQRKFSNVTEFMLTILMRQTDTFAPFQHPRHRISFAFCRYCYCRAPTPYGDYHDHSACYRRVREDGTTHYR